MERAVCTSFFSIVLPLVGPGLTAAAILTFLGAWGQYLVPLIFSPTATKPLTVLIPEFVTKNFIDYGLITASGSIAILIPALSSSSSTATSSAACLPGRSDEAKKTGDAKWELPNKPFSSNSPIGESALGSTVAARLRGGADRLCRLRHILQSRALARGVEQRFRAPGDRGAGWRVGQSATHLSGRAGGRPMWSRFRAAARRPRRSPQQRRAGRPAPSSPPSPSSRKLNRARIATGCSPPKPIRRKASS